MDPFDLVTLVSLAIVLIMIAREQRINIHKVAAGGLLLAVVMVVDWLQRSAHGTGAESYHEHLTAEIADTIFLLISAMALVGTIIVLRGFDIIITLFARFALHQRGVLNAFALLAFATSPIIDNATTAVMIIGMARELLTANLNSLEIFGEQGVGEAVPEVPFMHLVGFVVVAEANASGAASFMGDVTTIMLWLAGKLTPLDALQWAGPPSFVFGAVILLGANLMLKESRPVDYSNRSKLQFSAAQWFLVILTFSSFFMTLVSTQMGYPPYYGLIAALGVIWVLIGYFQVRTNQMTHLDVQLEVSLTSVHVSTLLFFVAILTPLGIMSHMGAIGAVVDFLYDISPNQTVVIGAIGLLSGFVDNVPIVQIAIDDFPITEARDWGLLAFSVGVGGTLLPFGSVPGVYAMGVIPGFTTGMYIRRFTPWVLLGFFAGLATGILQVVLFG
jgi:Na+/H+ antiporter NhaD/arsenite permease-like protein